MCLPECCIWHLVIANVPFQCPSCSLSPVFCLPVAVSIPFDFFCLVWQLCLFFVDKCASVLDSQVCSAMTWFSSPSFPDSLLWIWEVAKPYWDSSVSPQKDIPSQLQAKLVILLYIPCLSVSAIYLRKQNKLIVLKCVGGKMCPNTITILDS